MTSEEMVLKLITVPKGTNVFVSYHAGNPPTLRAKLEATKADHEKYNRRYYYGELESLRTNKEGQPVFTIKTLTRYNIKDLKAEWNYRSFNAEVGELLGLEVI